MKKDNISLGEKILWVLGMIVAGYLALLFITNVLGTSCNNQNDTHNDLFQPST